MIATVQPGASADPAINYDRFARTQLDGEAGSIFARRVQSGHTILEKYVPGIGRYLSFEIFADARHAYFGIFPTAERAALEKRRKQYGTVYPGLYSINGLGVMNNRNVGRVSVAESKGPVMTLGQGKGKSRIITDCAFDLKSNATYGVANLKISSPDRAFDYRIYLVFFVVFGSKYNLFNAGSSLDDQVAAFFSDNRPTIGLS